MKTRTVDEIIDDTPVELDTIDVVFGIAKANQNALTGIVEALGAIEPVCLTPVLEAIDNLATAISDIKAVPEEGFFNPQKLLDKEEYQELCGHCEYRRDG